MNIKPSRAELEEFARLLDEAAIRKERKRQARPGGLLEFVRYFWHVLEPNTPLVDGDALEAICLHLEAVTFGEITRLLMNVPPGFMKSLLTDVFWPAWEWGPMEMPHLRYVAFSYAASLTLRDNGRFRDLIVSPEYQRMWGHVFKPRKVGEEKITNDKTGWKFASSVGGVATGERGNRVILDDPHSVKEAESDTVRNETVRWFKEAMSNRLNDLEKDAIVIIMQRVHETDVSGAIISGEMDYVHLCIPMEYETGRHCETSIGWSDWRSEDGELAWEDRFPERIVSQMRSDIGPYAYAGQYQQRPEPRGGGIFKRDWWQIWEPEDNKFPPFDYIVASLDSAFTEREENDPSALTVWGMWRDGAVTPRRVDDHGQVWADNTAGFPKVMLIHAWRKHLEMHGEPVERLPGEGDAAYQRRSQSKWGLIEWVAATCRRYRVDRLLIEAKASGITAAQEMRRLYGTESWVTEEVQVRGDKVARAHAVVPAWSQGLIYRPDKEWAVMVEDEMSSFPRGRYKDLTDSSTQAIQHLRKLGLIQHEHERVADDTHRSMLRRKPQALYPV